MRSKHGAGVAREQSTYTITTTRFHCGGLATHAPTCSSTTQPVTRSTVIAPTFSGETANDKTTHRKRRCANVRTRVTDTDTRERVSECMTTSSNHHRHTHTQTHTHTDAHTHTRTDAHASTSTHAHTDAHTHTHTHRRTHARVLFLASCQRDPRALALTLTLEKRIGIGRW